MNEQFQKERTGMGKCKSGKATSIRHHSGRGIAELLERRLFLSKAAVPFPTPLLPRGTAGTLIFDGSVSASLKTNDDTSVFTLALDAPQTLTLLVDPASTLRPMVELRDSFNHQIGIASSASTGKDVLLQTVPITVDGVYTINVSSVGAGSMGAFSLKATLNAAMEVENYDGPPNHTLAESQRLDAAFVSPGPRSQGRIASVMGKAAPSAQTAMYSEGFESGTLGADWSVYASTVNGRSRAANTNSAASGTYALLMDTAVTGNNLNEAIWTVDLSGKASAMLTFSSISYNDELTSLPTNFSGHFQGDGVAISGDGTNWHTIWTGQSPASWTQVSVDLAAAATQAGIPLGSGFKIKFQQFDNNPISGGDGRGYDAIVITSAVHAEDYFSFPAAAGQTLALAGKVLPGSSAHLTVRLLDSAGSVLAQGVSSSNFDQFIAAVSAPKSGLYYVEVSADQASDYTLTVTKDLDLDVESNDSLGLAKPVGAREVEGHRQILGYVEPEVAASQTITFDELPGGSLSGTTIKGVTFSGNGFFGPNEGPGKMTYVSPPMAGGSTSGAVIMTLPAPCSGFNFFFALSTTGAIENAVIVQLYNGSALVGTYPVTSMPMPTFTEGQFYYYNETVPVTKAVLNFNSSAAAVWALDNIGYRLESAGGVDVYSVPLSAGESLVVRSYTAGGGLGEFTSTLDPALELVDENGIRVAYDDNGAEDGRNAILDFVAPVTRNYFLRVLTSAPGGKGEYLLSLSGSELTLAAPSDLQEGSASASTLSVFPTPTSDLVVSLHSSDPSRLSLPTTVTIPAGQNSVPITLNVIDNNLLDGAEEVKLSATAAGYSSDGGSITVHDDESSSLTLTLPASLGEGSGGVLATITSGSAPTRDVLIRLSSDVPARVGIPATVLLPAGYTSTSFYVSPIDNKVIDGTNPASLSAFVENWVGATAQLQIEDDDAQIAVSVPTPPSWEGQILSGAGKVTIGGTLTSDLLVTLLSSDIGEVQLPATVSIPAGQTEAFFDLVLPTDGIKDGGQAVQVSASASGLIPGNATMVVHDAELDHLGFEAIDTPKTAAVPFLAGAWAYNIDNEVIGLYAGSAALTASGGQGALSASPAVVDFVAGHWSGNVSIGAVDLSVALRLDSGGAAATSNLFAVQPGPVTHFRWDLLPSPQVAHLPFAATITALDANNFTATGFSGPVTFSGKVGSSTIIPITPMGSVFANGVWAGDITVMQSALDMYLHVQDSAGHAGDSGVFDVVQRVLNLVVPAEVREDQVTVTGILQVSPAPATDLVVTLTNSKPSRLSLPAAITVPAGQTSVALPITILNNSVLDGLETANLVATADNYAGSSKTVSVHDDESTILTVSLPPSAIENDGAVTGTISVADAVANDIVVQLISSNPARATTPATVVIPAGQSSATFTLTLINNAVIDGEDFVTVTAGVENWVGGLQSMLVSDDDNYLLVTLPASGWEGQLLNGAGVVRIGGTLTQDLLVDLVSSDNTELGVPDSIIIPAGKTSATFDLALRADALRDGAQTIAVFAAAPGPFAIATGSGFISVKDATLDHFTFETITGPLTANVPFPVTARAMNVDNEPLLSYAGSAALDGLRAGNSIPVAPASIEFAAGLWAGDVVVNEADLEVALRIDQGGIIGQSNVFAVLPVAPLAPVLYPTSDSGISNADGITKLDNSATDKTLQFTVDGTAPGARVELYASGVLIGSAIASGATTAITTDGITSLSEGDITITARQSIGDAQSPDSRILSIRVDKTAPGTSPALFEMQTEQAVTFDSSEAIGSFGSDVVVLQNLTASQTLPPAAISVQHLGNHYTLVFSGVPGGILPDGNYLLTIPAGSITDLAGNPSKSDLIFSFFVLGGDANRDRVVDINDLYILASNFRTTGRVFSQGDFDYDGDVDAQDLGILASHWQAVLPAALPLARPSVAGAPRRTATRAITLIE